MEFRLASNSQQSSCLSFSVVITGLSFHFLFSKRLSLIFLFFLCVWLLEKLLTLLSWFPSALALSSPTAQEVLRFFWWTCEARGSTKPCVGGAGYGRAGPSRIPLGKAEKSSWERPGGLWFQNFQEGFEYKVEGIGYLTLASSFLILEVPVVLSGFLRREKPAASAPGADPKGLDAAPGRLASRCWGRGEEVLLAPPFAPARRAPSG